MVPRIKRPYLRTFFLLKGDIKMNVVLEAFMKQFSDNEFAVKITKNGIRLEIEEK